MVNRRVLYHRSYNILWISARQEYFIEQSKARTGTIPFINGLYDSFYSFQHNIHLNVFFLFVCFFVCLFCPCSSQWAPILQFFNNK